MSPHRARTWRASLAAGVIAGALATATSPADATTSSVSAGDEIDNIENGGSHRCTLGYTFTRPDGLTYGITAGHCNAAPSRYVLDRTTGATGRLIVTVHEPDGPFDDYGVIDFGTAGQRPPSRACPSRRDSPTPSTRSATPASRQVCPAVSSPARKPTADTSPPE